jgi:hypothetical protein
VNEYTKFEAAPKSLKFYQPSVAERLALKEAGIILDTRLADLSFAKAAEAVGPNGAEFLIPASLDGYRSLSDVLARAFDQAAAGKGAERHGQGQPFDEQPMQQLIRLYGIGFALGQAAKKAQEAQRLPTVERQVAELLGAINYLAGAVIALERGDG